MKPFSQSCENNKTPILNEIYPLFETLKHVLEIGSGTGQHAVFFAKQLSNLTFVGYPEKLKITTTSNDLLRIQVFELNDYDPFWYAGPSPANSWDIERTSNDCHVNIWSFTPNETYTDYNGLIGNNECSISAVKCIQPLWIFHELHQKIMNYN